VQKRTPKQCRYLNTEMCCLEHSIQHKNNDQLLPDEHLERHIVWRLIETGPVALHDVQKNWCFWAAAQVQSTLAAALQEQVANLKSEAAQAAEQLRQAKSKTEDAEKDLNATRQSAYEDSQAAIKDKQQAHTTITNLQVCASLSDE